MLTFFWSGLALSVAASRMIPTCVTPASRNEDRRTPTVQWQPQLLCVLNGIEWMAFCISCSLLLGYQESFLSRLQCAEGLTGGLSAQLHWVLRGMSGRLLPQLQGAPQVKRG
jgi:hypothetical protein